MDRLISFEPSKVVAIRVEPGERCRGELTLRNVMHTMPVAFRFQPLNPSRYSVRPQFGIIPPLAALTMELVYHLPAGNPLPDGDALPHAIDSFLLHSVVVPGAGVKDAPFSLDSIPLNWFTTTKKMVFIDCSVRVVFVGSAVLARLFSEGDPSLEVVREVLERSNPKWRPADSVDPDTGETLLQLAVARGRPSLVQLLLEFGPNLDFKGRSGLTPLEAAAAAGETLIAELLIANRASLSRRSESPLGPLHLAAAGGHTELLRLLLSKGVDPDEPTSDGRTALRMAVEAQRKPCIELLPRLIVDNDAGDGMSSVSSSAASSSFSSVGRFSDLDSRDRPWQSEVEEIPSFRWLRSTPSPTGNPACTNSQRERDAVGHRRAGLLRRSEAGGVGGLPILRRRRQMQGPAEGIHDGGSPSSSAKMAPPVWTAVSTPLSAPIRTTTPPRRLRLPLQRMPVAPLSTGSGDGEEEGRRGRWWV